MLLKIVNPTRRHPLDAMSTAPLEKKQSQTMAKCQGQVLASMTQQPLMKVAGRLASFIHTWKLLTGDLCITKGFKFQHPNPINETTRASLPRRTDSTDKEAPYW